MQEILHLCSAINTLIKNIKMDNNFIIDPEELAGILNSTTAARNKIYEYIDDEISSCDEFDDHTLAPIHSDALRAVQKIEKLITDILIGDTNGAVRSKFEEIILIDTLAGRETPLKRILLKTKNTASN